MENTLKILSFLLTISFFALIWLDIKISGSYFTLLSYSVLANGFFGIVTIVIYMIVKKQKK
jgi:hypothetical protein